MLVLGLLHMVVKSGFKFTDNWSSEKKQAKMCQRTDDFLGFDMLVRLNQTFYQNVLEYGR